MKSVIVTGASGFMGRALVSRLGELGVDCVGLSSRDADLLDPRSLDRYDHTKYDHIFHLAAWYEVGDPSLHHLGQQWLNNQQINTTVLGWWQAHQPQAKLVSIGTSAAYEDGGDYREENYLKGDPIQSLYTYAMSKRMLLTGQMNMGQEYGLKWLSVIASTVYGPGPNTSGRQLQFIFDITRKILDYKYNNEAIALWGDGYQRRELVHVSDFVNEMLELSNLDENTVVNIGEGNDHTIREFAEILCEAAEVDPAVIQYDTSMNSGSKSKRLNAEKLERLLPGKSRIPLRDGLFELVLDMEQAYKSERVVGR